MSEEEPSPMDAGAPGLPTPDGSGSQSPMGEMFPGVPGLPGMPDASAAGGLAGQSPLGAMPGGSTVGGIAQDATQMASAAQSGDANQAADAAVNMAATGTAAYFGGEPAAAATRAVLNSAPGSAAKKGIIAAVGVLVGTLILGLMSSAAAVTGVMSLISSETGVLAACETGGGGTEYQGGSGGIWAMKFLHGQGLRGEPLKVMWSIVMRESGGDPANRTPETGTYDNGTYDAGLYQTNSSNESTLKEYGLTMQDAFDPVKSFNFWMRRASPNGKLMSSLGMWGHFSWNDTSLNAASYTNWTPAMHQEMIVAPFAEKYASSEDAARQAGVEIGSSADSRVTLTALGSYPAVTLTINGAAPAATTAREVRSARQAQQDGRAAPTVSRAQAPPTEPTVPVEDQTVSGFEALKADDPRLVTFEVAGNSVTVHQDFQRLFNDFLLAWDSDPILGKGRLSLREPMPGMSQAIDSYEYRRARAAADKWSDHAGYAIDIRYDILKVPNGDGTKYMTKAEEEATRTLLKRFPQMGWGGDYSPEYMDEMHFYVAPGSVGTVPPVSDPCAAGGGGGYAPGEPVPVSPGATVLPSEDSVLPQYGWTVNKEGGRNMVYYSQCDGRWGSDSSVFWNGGICGCGCGPTSFSMVVATLAKRPDFTPPDSVAMQKQYGGINAGCGTGALTFFDQARKFGLASKNLGTSDWEGVKDTIRRGGLVMASLNAGYSPRFQTGYHYIVFRGITADGKFLVADPGNIAQTIGKAWSPSDFSVNRGLFAFLPPGQSF